MKKLVACLFAAAAMTAAPLPALALEVAVACGPDVPESWKRPGGYCDKISGGGSLSTFVEGCEGIVLGQVRPRELTEGVLVAALEGLVQPVEVAAIPCEIECGSVGNLGVDLGDMDRLLVAGC